MKNILFYLLLSIPSSIFAQGLGTFDPANQPIGPDYSQDKYWAALPFKEDVTDEVPKFEEVVNDSLKEVDVFYIYPTVYLNGNTWNADVDNKSLNNRIDKYPVKYHGSVFNQVARVFAPRYRQAILKSFMDTTGNGEKALAFAYNDVKIAFEYYLKHYNNGRPIIIASHSQGTYHARRLINEFFDEPNMKKKLVCAYIIGFGINEKDYEILTPCESPTETNCYITWASFKNGYDPIKSPLYGDVCINPINWTRDTLLTEESGGILLNIHQKKFYKTQVQINGSYLWIKTNTPIVGAMKNMHVADYNLFWHEIRKNVKLRSQEFLQKNR